MTWWRGRRWRSRLWTWRTCEFAGRAVVVLASPTPLPAHPPHPSHPTPPTRSQRGGDPGHPARDHDAEAVPLAQHHALLWRRARPWLNPPPDCHGADGCLCRRPGVCLCVWRGVGWGGQGGGRWHVGAAAHSRRRGVGRARARGCCSPCAEAGVGVGQTRRPPPAHTPALACLRRPVCCCAPATAAAAAAAQNARATLARRLTLLPPPSPSPSHAPLPLAAQR